MFAGMEIIAVDPGTVIKIGDDELTVTDTQAVTKGRKIYMTHKQVAALRTHPSVTTSQVGSSC